MNNIQVHVDDPHEPTVGDRIDREEKSDIMKETENNKEIATAEPPVESNLLIPEESSAIAESEASPGTMVKTSHRTRPPLSRMATVYEEPANMP